MNNLQREIIRLTKTDRNSVKEIARNIGESEFKTRQLCDELLGLGLLTTNMVKTAYFS